VWEFFFLPPRAVVSPPSFLFPPYFVFGWFFFFANLGTDMCGFFYLEFFFFREGAGFFSWMNASPNLPFFSLHFFGN